MRPPYRFTVPELRFAAASRLATSQSFLETRALELAFDDGRATRD